MRLLLIFIGVLALLLPSSASATREADESAFAQARTGRGLTLHKEMFVLPFTWSDKYHGSQTEVVFQLSAKHGLFGTRFYLAYSQISTGRPTTT